MEVNALSMEPSAGGFLVDFEPFFFFNIIEKYLIKSTIPTLMSHFFLLKI